MNKDLSSVKGSTTKTQDTVQYKDLPKALKKQGEADALAQKKKTLSREDIIVANGNESNRTIIYKFMKKGF